MSNAWILILFLTGQTQGGEAIHSVRFKTEKGCKSALAELPSKDQMFATWGRQSLFGICVEDK